MDWRLLIDEGDAQVLWNGLYRLVSNHLRVSEKYWPQCPDSDLISLLAQDLFLKLVCNQRFDEYLERSYSSAEIDDELTLVEIPRLVLSSSCHFEDIHDGPASCSG